MITTAANKFRIATKATLCLLGASALLTAVSTANATVELGNPFIPTGADYSITGVAAINPTNGNGGSSSGAQVNRDFEFKGAYGVSYTQAGKLVPFGLGLYTDSSGALKSGGLNVTFNNVSLASSVNITLCDFDIDTKATFFNPGKVEPSIQIYGAGGVLIGTATPTNVFNSMKPSSQGKDYWDLNFGALLSSMGQSPNAGISGFLLYADSNAGEKANSDPYFLVAVAGVPMVPEPSTYVGGAALIALLLGLHTRAVLKKKNSSLV
jgi:hypothetical protein